MTNINDSQLSPTPLVFRIKNPGRSEQEKEALFIEKAKELGMTESKEKLELSMEYYVSNKEFNVKYQEELGMAAVQCMMGG